MPEINSIVAATQFDLEERAASGTAQFPGLAPGAIEWDHPAMIGKTLPALAILLTLSACDAYPRDIEGTLDAVKRDKVIHVGIVTARMSPAAQAAATAYLARVGAATAARPRFTAGSAEPLLAQLEQGKLDLVIGDFASDTPWALDVSVLEPIASYRVGKRDLGLSPVARNGENAWIMLLERAVRETRGGK
jgi:hypothetical protein